MSFNVTAKVQFPEYLTGGLEAETGGWGWGRGGWGGVGRKQKTWRHHKPTTPSFPFFGKKSDYRNTVKSGSVG